MKYAGSFLLVFLLSTYLGAQEPESSEVDSLMALDFEAFDQDMQGGWRYYANQKRFAAAASLIQIYLDRNTGISEFEREVMFWHAGQMLAIDGQEERAIPLMEKSRKKEDDFMLWNPYLDATIAFLNKDRPAFDKNLKAVAAISNNPNLPLLELLGKHFDKSYREVLESVMR